MGICLHRIKGSQGHILDLISSVDFVATMHELLGAAGRMAEPCCSRPIGQRTEQDRKESQLEDYLVSHPVPNIASPLPMNWWLTFGTRNRPKWDLLCRIVVNDKPGLLLVEAKAHKGEMLQENKKRSPDGPKDSKSRRNDTQIRGCIGWANSFLSERVGGNFSLSADHHYQLANRLTYMSKVASAGVPTILLYLGWLNSPDWPRDRFRDHAEWCKSMREYASDVCCEELMMERTFPAKNGGSFQMLVRSLEVPRCDCPVS